MLAAIKIKMPQYFCCFWGSRFGPFSYARHPTFITLSAQHCCSWMVCGFAIYILVDGPTHFFNCYIL